MTMQTTFAPGCLYEAINENYQLLFLIEKEGPLGYKAFNGRNSALVMSLDSVLHEFPVRIWTYETLCLKCLWNEQIVHLLVDSNVKLTPIDEAWGTEEEAKEDDS